MKMTEEQRRLAEENHNLIYGFLNQNKLDDDEFYDLASIGLCKAAMKYNTDRKEKFSTFAYTCMRNEVKNYFINFEGAKKRIPKELVSSYNIELDDGKEILDVFIKNDDFIEDSLICLDFNSFKKTLTDKECAIIEYLENDFKTSEIAKEFNCSHQYICQLKMNIKRKWERFYNRS